MTPTSTNTDRPCEGSETLILNPGQAQAVVRLVEAAPAVRRRHQFFVWTQSQMQALLPHQLLVCGAYQRQRRALVLDAFYNLVLPADVLQQFSDAGSALPAALVQAWLGGRSQPVAVDMARLGTAAAAAGQRVRAALGCSHLLVHGVSRPQRPDEIESLFILGAADGLAASASLAQRCACLDLMLPHLHSTWQRVSANELVLQGTAGSLGAALARPAAGPAAAAATSATTGVVTERERQILRWVREGLSNQEIAAVLGISPLTVKNHIQKILRKLNAGNRAQAVAQALAHQLIDAAKPAGRTPPPPPPPLPPPGERSAVSDP